MNEPFFQKTEKNEFLQFFYKRCMPKLCGPLVANTERDRPLKGNGVFASLISFSLCWRTFHFSDDYHTANLCSVLLDLLTFCIEHHSYHVRSYIISKDLLKRVLVLLKSRHAFLGLSKSILFGSRDSRLAMIEESWGVFLRILGIETVNQWHFRFRRFATVP